MSMEERLAWAKKHHVQPPARAKVKVIATAFAADHTFCGTPPTSKRYRVRSAAMAQTNASPNDGEKTRQPGRKPRFDWVIGMRALECQGLATYWVTSGAVSLPPKPVELTITIAVTDFESIDPLVWPSVVSSPDVPPPRWA